MIDTYAGLRNRLYVHVMTLLGCAVGFVFNAWPYVVLGFVVQQVLMIVYLWWSQKRASESSD